MNCNDYTVLLEKFLEGTLSQEEEMALLQHESECPACADRHAALDELPDLLSSLADDVPPLPEDFHQGWMRQVEETAMEHKPRSKQPWLRTLAAAAAVMFVIGGTLLTRDTLSPAAGTRANQALPQAAAYDYDTASEAGYGMARGSMLKTGVAMDAPAEMAETEMAAAEKKIIRTASLTIATQDYDGSLLHIKELCAESGGWISYVWESTGDVRRSASLTLRIPSDKLDAFLAGADGAGRITRREERADDVTESYQDTAAQLATQQALMERLQALITDAADLSDLLALESQIAATQYQIDRLQSSLNTTDREVDYATVDVTLREEIPADSITDSKLTFGERLIHALSTGWEAFTDFLKDAGVFLAAALPFIAIAAAAWASVHFIRKSRKNRKD